MEDLDTTRAGSTAAGTSRSSEGAQGRASADETCEDATTPQNDFYETLVSRYQAKATELAALTAHNQLARLQRSSRLQDNESLNLAASSANPAVRTSVGVGNRHPFPVTASAMSTESNAQLVSRNADSSVTLASAPAPSSQSSAQLLSRSALSAEADRSSPHKRWAEALQRSAESELKKLFPGIHQVSAIIKEFLSCACQLTVVTIRKKLDQAERLLKNCSVRKFIASYAKVVYTTQLSLADQRFLEATVRTNLNYIGNATDGGRKGVLVRAFVGVYREDLANNAKAFSTSLSAKGHVHEGFSFGEGPPSTLVHYLVVALLLYAVPLFTPDPSGEAGIEIHPVVAPQDRDFLTWIQTVLKAAVKVPQREPAPQIKYDSYEMGDVAARVAEAIIDESDRRCETIRMNLRNSGCERDTNTGTHALRAIDKTSVYGKIAESIAE
ncbi:Hypothetical Protein FCC1311_070132 [Hondaea fermentalgiana]|uniref:Uncharacterized protein n=1 Tax=Hondaea fermentalgiana TaxID=2315210 RepID=A0A2R5GQ92_9STRA|nr:Hypothetical Protein FCC1311_070132 [Hondaea fermentalgiana]|eukprot:GBG30793.1 Hypothetical Protein FCC1311_070132 [Hondaea fermentalgiana]